MRRARVDNARPETLDFQPPWAEKRLRDLAAAHGASISINGPSKPKLMNGADPDRATRERSSRIPGQHVYLREVQRNALRFCVVAYPLEGWCAPVYPELPRPRRRAVALDLASFCRVAGRPRGRLGPSRRDALGARRVAQRARARPDRAARAGHRSRGRHGARQVVRRRRDDRPRRPVPRQHADGGGLHEPRSAAHDRHVPVHAAAHAGRSAHRRHPRPVRSGRLVEVGADDEADRPISRRTSPATAAPRGSARSRWSTPRRGSASRAARTASRCWTRTPRATSRSARATPPRATRRRARQQLADPRRRDDRRARHGGHRLRRGREPVPVVRDGRFQLR